MKRTIVTLMAGVILLSACSGSGEGDTPAPTERHPSPTEEATVAEQSAPATTPAHPHTGTREQPLHVGTSAIVGNDWEVTVTKVTLNANEIVAADEFNDPPNGQYVMVELAVTFLGNVQTESNPGMDLVATIVGSDARQYNDFDHTVVVEGGLMDAPTLEPGGTFTGTFTIDVPPAVLEGAHLFIDATMSMDDEGRKYWVL